MDCLIVQTQLPLTSGFPVSDKLLPSTCSKILPRLLEFPGESMKGLPNVGHVHVLLRHRYTSDLPNSLSQRDMRLFTLVSLAQVGL